MTIRIAQIALEWVLLLTKAKTLQPVLFSNTQVQLTGYRFSDGFNGRRYQSILGRLFSSLANAADMFYGRLRSTLFGIPFFGNISAKRKRS